MINMMRKAVLIGKLMMVFTLALSAVAWNGNITGIVEGNSIKVL